MTNRIAFLDPALAAYIDDHSTGPSPLEQRLINVTASLGGPSIMQISHPQARFMAMLARLLRPKVVVEIGTFTGYSALVVAQELGRDATLIACDLSDEWTSIGQPFWEEAGVGDHIDLRLGLASDTLAELPSDLQIDMAFIDADKEAYLGYLHQLIPHLHARSVVLVDNVLWDGNIAKDDDQSDSTVALRNFNRAVVDDPRLEVSLLPIGDGLSMITLAG